MYRHSFNHCTFTALTLTSLSRGTRNPPGDHSQADCVQGQHEHRMAITEAVLQRTNAQARFIERTQCVTTCKKLTPKKPKELSISIK
jgi:hypothetical protein